MDFQQLLAKMVELDRPSNQNTAEACGDPMPPMGMTPPVNDQPPPAHPSLSINLNAQGMDHIEQIMKLVAKVNPEMEKPSMPPLPSLSPEPSIMSIKPSLPPLKMLPDLDSEPEGDHPEPDADNFGGPSDNDADNKIDIIQKSMGDMDSDGDKDSDDEDGDDKEKKDEWANGLTGHDDVDYKGMDAAVPDGNDLNKPKKSFSDKPYRGDNPMAAESTDLRSQIRAELLRRLNESKGVK